MVSLLRYPVVMTIFVVGHCASCPAQGIASDFQQVLAALPEPVADSPVMMFEDANAAAADIASRYSDPASVEFLKTQAKSVEGGKAAMLALVRIAARNTFAKDALVELSRDDDYRIRRDAVTVLAYIDPNNARPIAESLLDMTLPCETRRGAVEILVGVGNAESLGRLRDWQLIEEDPFVGKSLVLTMRELEYRLTEVPKDEQAAWAEQELVFWRTLRQSPMFRKVDAENGFAASYLSKQGKQFSRGFLEHKLQGRNMLAIAIAGHQQEDWAVPFLKPCAYLTGSAGDYARVALAEIATDDAIRAMEDSIWPGGSTRANWHLLTILRSLGDEQTVEKLNKLAATGRFSKAERQSILRTSELIQQRLNQ